MTDEAWLRLLQGAWRDVNWRLFGEGLRPVVMKLDDSRRRLAGWQRQTRTITVSRSLLERPWPVVVEVLKHEMAHQYAHEVLGAVDESAHGPAFRKVCAERGIDARAAGEPEASDSRVLDRVRKLLALAESPELHEAESAARMARRLMLEHHVSESDLHRRPFRVRHLGRATSRFMTHEKLLAGVLSKHFFVECIHVQAVLPDGRMGRMLEICGREEDVAVAEHVYGWLLATADRLYAAHRRNGGKGRGRFLSGVVMGFGEQLDAETARCAETGLVHVPDAPLREYVTTRHPRLVKGRGIRLRADSAFSAGRSEGRKVKLHPAVAKRGPRLLEG
ncbi:MAG: DUF2786 domain-containing protein [Deltaproteobacteria bacterium]|nr:MAG: DUF2786 domain-containing protein [Deltaproteobacteria bacterium]